MKITRLLIEEVPSWKDENKGMYLATVSYDNGDAKTEIVLDAQISTSLLAFIGPAINASSRKICLSLEADLQMAVLQAQSAAKQLIELTPEVPAAAPEKEAVAN